MSKLADKVAIVTGASKGIGAAIARHLAAEGAAVVVNYASNQESARRVVSEIVAGGGKAVAVQADASRAEDLDRLFAETKRIYGHLDVLVNNAGVYEFATLDQVTEEHFHRQFNLNVLGLILASQRAARHFNGSGSIINISSVAGVAPVAGASVYSATKGAVDAVTKSLAQELGPRKIRVNSLNPGMVETEGVHSLGLLGSDFHQQVVEKTPLGRIAQPDDVARVAVFLASEDSGWVTGETLLVSGGHK